MKVDGLGVILAIILMPIILVVTYYIQMQVDTVSKKNAYNSKLLDATYDAMSAFEINTANEELSTVSDSMRSIVLASNNVFFNTLSTDLGISNSSKELIRPYIPAILYTMYDGYYIYAPTETLEVAEKKEVQKGDDDTTDKDDLIITKGYRYVGDGVDDGYNQSYNGEGYYGDILYEGKNGSLTSNPDEARPNTDYVLKSYMPYSARYKNDLKKIDITINYTLDNYLNIVGTVGDIYYTKTGYLIDPSLVKSIGVGIYSGSKFDDKNEKDVEYRVLGKKTDAIETTIAAENDSKVELNNTLTITSQFSKVKEIIKNREGIEILTVSEAEEYLEKFYEKYDSVSDETERNNLLTDIQTIEYELQNCRAVAYYASSAIFTSWVYNNLADLTYGDIYDTALIEYYGYTKDEDGIWHKKESSKKNFSSTSGIEAEDLFYDFKDSSVSAMKIFEKEGEYIDPESPQSNFNTHKMEVIKNSIKYNLNLSMSAYSKMDHPYNCSLPVLTDEEWDKILKNISIVSFMQGWNCGLDIYNNYQIVSSTNNELTVTPSEIYYVKKDLFNKSTGDYHRIDCKSLEYDVGTQYISFKSKESKYDKVKSKNKNGGYKFDHKNFACYKCINVSNYDSLFSEDSVSYYEKIKSLDKIEKVKAGYIAIANERQRIYKTNALTASEGYKILKDTTINSNNGIINISDLKVSGDEVKSLQITFSEVEHPKDLVNQSKAPVMSIKITSTDGFSKDINLKFQKRSQTFIIDLDEKNVNGLQFEKIEPTYNATYEIENIKAIYK